LGSHKQELHPVRENLGCVRNVADRNARPTRWARVRENPCYGEGHGRDARATTEGALRFGRMGWVAHATAMQAAEGAAGNVAGGIIGLV